MSELMDVVDENNNIIGQKTRKEIHNSGMWHRGIHILIFNSKNQLLFPLRSTEKDKFPNTYDCSVSEHLKAGETYEEATLRGLKEELNVSARNLKRVMTFRMNYGPNDNMISALYELRYDGAFDADRKEIQNAEFISTGKVKEMIENSSSNFSPWAYEILKWYFHMQSRIERLS